MIRDFLQTIFAVDSVWSIVFRFIIWMAIAITIIASVDAVNKEKGMKNLKSNLGLFLMLLFLTGIMIYFIFGFIPSF